MTSKNSKRKKKSKQVAPPYIVGPDYIQILKGKILSKNVSIVLCGESHEEAIDVTRSGGYFKPKEGWIPTSIESLSNDSVEALASASSKTSSDFSFSHRIWKKKERLASVEKAKEWSASIMKEVEVDYGEDVLLVCMNEFSSKKKTAFILVLKMPDNDDDNESDSDSSDIVNEDKSTNIVDMIVNKLNQCINEKLRNDGKKSSPPNEEEKKDVLIFEWEDLDEEARKLNRVRLFGQDEIPLAEYDKIIQKRKKNLNKNENTWTFDDWFSHVKQQSDSDKHCSLDLVLESPIPPWDVELCRKNIDCENVPLAADFIRCISDDSEASSGFDFDPSADGVGAYLDFVYRKFMSELISQFPDSEETNKDDIIHNYDNIWMHCVDCRDLGCETAHMLDSLKSSWMNKLLPDEYSLFTKDKSTHQSKASSNAPKWVINPEQVELVSLREKGLLTVPESNSDEDGQPELACDMESDNSADIVTFPSFEGFFGQNTDILYYSLHVKAYYSPFLAKCVGSLSKWEAFFTHLFLGGTVPDAISTLSLHDDCDKKYIHLRSPILKHWDPNTNQYEWLERDDEEENITFPFLPFHCYLMAKGSSPPRTWSSNLYANLAAVEDYKHFAYEAKKWTLEVVKKYSADPKNLDDAEGGGEWFLAYLRAAHREIYDDIDRTDPTVLLHRKHMDSEKDGKRRKHNIGSITIPSCQSGFSAIVDEFSKIDMQATPINMNGSGPSVQKMECMAKILIDIWMGSLVDFSTILKILTIVLEKANISQNKHVVVVCYMGSVHTKAIANFFNTRLGFTRKAFAGNLNWDEDASRKIKLPNGLWNLKEL